RCEPHGDARASLQVHARRLREGRELADRYARVCVRARAGASFQGEKRMPEREVDRAARICQPRIRLQTQRRASEEIGARARDAQAIEAAAQRKRTGIAGKLRVQAAKSRFTRLDAPDAQLDVRVGARK